jgi:hypothetical protein
MLNGLGFVVKDGTKPGHKVVSHPKLSGQSDFVGTSYTCGHGKNPPIKPIYAINLRKTLEIYREWL